MKIIVSLYAYNFHLFVSYLKGGLEILPFRDNRIKIFKREIDYKVEIPIDNSLTELQAENDVLYGSSESKLKVFDLGEKSEFINFNNNSSEFYDTPNDILQITLSRIKHNLFALSESKGIVQMIMSNKSYFQESNPSKIYNKVRKNFIPSTFDKIGNPTVSNMEINDNNLLISLRNHGVENIFISKGIFSELSSIRSSDPQDVKNINSLNMIVIADSKDGLVFYDNKYYQRIKKIKLPENDFPQQIEVSFSTVIVKGTKALYKYDYIENKFEVISEGKTGALTSYYDYIFFTKKGNLFLSSINKKSERNNLNYDKEKISTV